MSPEIELKPLKQLRDDMIADLMERKLPPQEAVERYVSQLDEQIGDFLDRHVHKSNKLVLLAVGGYGRRQLCPYSDLDLTLVDNHRLSTSDKSSQLWYYIWDSGLSLDHSVRHKKEVLALAKQDVKVALGLLDARPIAGNHKLGMDVIDSALSQWAAYGYKFLDDLMSSTQKRYELFGELAYLLEPDLKQSAGGLRDISILKAFAKFDDSVRDLVEARSLEIHETLITNARVLEHAVSMRENDRLLLQDQAEVASLLGYDNEDLLMKDISEAGRAIQTTYDDAWRRINKKYIKKAITVNVDIANPHISFLDGELCLADSDDYKLDMDTVLELALAAAQQDLLINVASLSKLQNAHITPDIPWTDRQRDLFIKLCATGASFIKTAEILDQHHLFEMIIPEWKSVRNLPQRNAYHKFTVDRHLLEAVARTKPLQADCERPDLLIIGALLHDIGKGRLEDHSELGAVLAYTIASRMGFSSEDIDTIVALVKYHLVLPEVATRRDLEDTGTIQTVARLLENKLTLHLLGALAEADGLATGSTAWSSWKHELITLLSQKVEDVLSSKNSGTTPDIAPRATAALGEVTHLTLQPRGKKLKVLAPDQSGLLAAVAGCLTLHGWQIKRAKISAPYPSVALEEFDLEQNFDKQVDWIQIQQDINDTLNKKRDLAHLLRAQDRSYKVYMRPKSAAEPLIRVGIDNATSEKYSILEVRAPDHVGMLYAITSYLAQEQLDVAAALVDTLGSEVIDVFYISDQNGHKITDQTYLENICSQIKTSILNIALAN